MRNVLDAEPLKTIADRLKSWRNHLGLKQDEFADLLGVNISVLRKWESKVNVPGGEALMAIGRTGVNLDWLLLGRGEMCVGASNRTDLQRRMDTVKGILEGIPEEKMMIVLDEIFSRVQEAKRVADLEQLVREMAKKFG